MQLVKLALTKLCLKLREPISQNDNEHIKIFRFFTGGVALVFLLFYIFPSQLGKTSIAERRAVLLFFINYGMIFLYLIIPSLEQRMKSLYLLPVLIYASIIPFAIISVKYNFAPLAANNQIQLLEDSMTATILLIFPLIITAWQYKFPIVFLFFVILGFLDPLLTFLANTNSETYNMIHVSVLRIIAMCAVGFIITELRRQQRQEHINLKKAYRKLAKFAQSSQQLATSRERNRIARDLHDTLAHTLSGLTIQLEAIGTLVKTEDTPLLDMINQAQKISREGLNETRRTLKALRATPLEDLGLIQALQQIAENAQNHKNIDIETRLTQEIPTWGANLEETIYRIAQEGLENIIRHAHASKAILKLTGNATSLHLKITDNGKGFDIHQPEAKNFEPRPLSTENSVSSRPVSIEHYGLRGMKERAESVDSELTIETSNGQGTVINFSWND